GRRGKERPTGATGGGGRQPPDPCAARQAIMIAWPGWRMRHPAEPAHARAPSKRYFQLKEAVIQPTPKDARSPPILVAGRGRNRALPLAARYANAWNAMFVTPSELAVMNGLLDDLLVQAGRKPHDLRRTVMQGVEVGRTEAEIEAKL